MPQSSILTALFIPGRFDSGSGSGGTAKAIVVDGIGERPTTTAGGEVDALKPPGGELELSALSVEPWIGRTSPEDNRAKRHQSVEYSGKFTYIQSA